MAVAEGLPPDQQPAVLAEALAAAQAIEYEVHRAEALVAVATRLPPDRVLLHQILQMVRTEKRETALGVLERLTPALCTLGGERAMRDVAQAITDTARWWP
jgi:hypothetical protein